MTEDSVIFTPEKSKKIALARLDLLNQWKEFRRKSDNKLQADYDFVNLHNTSNSHLFEILGKISRGTLHRWNNTLNGTEDYTKLIPQYKYAKVDEYRTCLTDEEIKIFMGLLLHPNRLCIGKAIALTKYKLQQQGQSYIPADITFAKLLGTVTDFEDYKQKIVKQRKLHKKTINAVKEYLSNDEVKYLETKMIEEISSPVQTEFKVRSKGVQKIFKNNSEKYEYLIKNDPNNSWITEFKNSKEYKLLYE